MVFKRRSDLGGPKDMPKKAKITLPTLDKPYVSKAKAPMDFKGMLTAKAPAGKPKVIVKPRTTVEPVLTATSEFVFHDSGVTVYRTPPEVIKWPSDFRMRYLRDWRKPDTILPMHEYHVLTSTNDVKYKVHGVTVRISYEDSSDCPQRGVVMKRIGMMRITRADLGRYVRLTYDNPALRSLVCYSFITGQVIGGLPKFKVFDTVQP